MILAQDIYQSCFSVSLLSSLFGLQFLSVESHSQLSLVTLSFLVKTAACCDKTIVEGVNH